MSKPQVFVRLHIVVGLLWGLFVAGVSIALIIPAPSPNVAGAGWLFAVGCALGLLGRLAGRRDGRYGLLLALSSAAVLVASVYVHHDLGCEHGYIVDDSNDAVCVYE